MAPRRVESWTEYWYPVRGLGGSVVEATSDLAVNARFPPEAGREPPPFKIQVSPTVAIDGVRVHLKAGSRLVRERSEEHTSELQSRSDLVCRLLLEKKKYKL